MATLFSAAETFAAQEKYTEAIQQYEFLANGKRNSDKTRSKAAFALGKLFYATESPTSGRQKSLYWFRCAVSHGNLEAAKTLQNDTMLPRLLQLGLPLPLCCRTAENCQRDSDQMCCLCGNAIVISKKNVTVSACCGALTHAKCKHELGDVYCACPSCVLFFSIGRSWGTVFEVTHTNIFDSRFTITAINCCVTTYSLSIVKDQTVFICETSSRSPIWFCVDHWTCWTYWTCKLRTGILTFFLCC